MFRIYNIYGDQLVFEDVSDTLENFSDDDYLLLISNGMPGFIRTSKLNIAVNTFEVATPTLSQNLTTNEISLSCETPNSIIYYSQTDRILLTQIRVTNIIHPLSLINPLL